MIEPRRYWIDSKPQARRVAEELLRLDVGPQRVAEVIVRPARREKTTSQRGLLHTLLAEAALHLHITPREAKEWLKEDYYGVDSKLVSYKTQDRRGRWRKRTMVVETVQSTEDEDRAGYGRLIDYLYQWAAEKGIVLTERRLP